MLNPRELQHRYGPQVHLVNHLGLNSLLAKLCQSETTQPSINELVIRIYQGLLNQVVAQEFSMSAAEIPTRMATAHPREGIYRGQIIDPKLEVVSVNLARAGTLPSHTLYTELNYLMPATHVRQDHISISRTTDSQLRVTGSQAAGVKIGGPVEDKLVLIPDPMAATGGTLVEVLHLYKSLYKDRGKKPPKFIAIHCICTPEYLKNVLGTHPDLVVYSLRLDRGLSPAHVLGTVPGTHWDQERGLNDQQYIVPGGGGFGEIMNNAES